MAESEREDARQADSNTKRLITSTSGDNSTADSQQATSGQQYNQLALVPENASAMNPSDTVQSEVPDKSHVNKDHAHDDNIAIASDDAWPPHGRNLKPAPICLPTTDVKCDPSISPENISKRRRVQHNYRRLSSSGYVDDYGGKDRFCGTSESDMSLSPTPPKIKPVIKMKSPSRVKPETTPSNGNGMPNIQLYMYLVVLLLLVLVTKLVIVDLIGANVLLLIIKP